MKKRFIFAGLTAVILGATMTLKSQATEEAKYQVLFKDQDFELRNYESLVQAEVSVTGSREEAGSKAFNLLFQYISGANISRHKIDMTAPVAQSEKIDMTAPVGVAQNGSTWTVSFVLPANYTLETSPEPSNPRVVLKSFPARQIATVRYAGGDDESTYQQHLKALKNWMQTRQLNPTGELIWARYNPPFTPPFWRRNEILMPVQP